MATGRFALKVTALLALTTVFQLAGSASGSGEICPGDVITFPPHADLYMEATMAGRLGLPNERLYLIKNGSVNNLKREELSQQGIIPKSVDVVAFRLAMPGQTYTCSASEGWSQNEEIAPVPELSDNGNSHITKLALASADPTFGRLVTFTFTCKKAGEVRLYINFTCNIYFSESQVVKKKGKGKLSICFTKQCSGAPMTNEDDGSATNGNNSGATILYAAITVISIFIIVIIMIIVTLHKSKNKAEAVSIVNTTELRLRLTGDGRSATEYSQSQADSRSRSYLPDSRYSVTGSTVLPSIDDSKAVQLTNGQPSSTSTDSGTCISVSMTSTGWQNHSPFKDLTLSGCIELGQLLQNGSYGQVYEGVWKRSTENSLPVLIKTTGSKATTAEVHSCASKAVLLRNCHHRHIRQVYGIFFASNAAPLMVFPHYTGQVNLKVLLTRARASSFTEHIVDDSVSENSVPSSLSTTDLIRLGYQLARACNKLSRSEFSQHAGIVHKDIAARNCIVLPDLELKLCDSALSSDLFSDEYHYHNKLGDRKGPLKWMAIECIEESFFSSCSDVWAFGVTFWEILTLGRMPYEDVDEHLMESYLRAGKRLEKPQRCSEELFKTIGCCWAFSPQDRPHFSTIKQNLYMQLDQMRPYSSPC